ncbi:MAG TPA: DUF2637 domain-containing protein [Micromonosporaceae bacterium]|nr:DUF2637 domain-containing protein [Micromonosporaceae bacterium]
MNINYRRVGYITSIGSVALIAAWGSYRHMLDVASQAGQPIEVAATLPLSVDGMLLCATLAMGDDKANGRNPRTWARFAFWLGAVISVSANIASTVVHRGIDPLSIGVAAWAPIALLVVTEIMARPGKPRPVEDATDTAPAPTKPRTPKDRLDAARKRAGYDQMSPTEKAAWTKRYNERTGRNAPTSPAGPLVPSEAELEEMTA